jgi:hypothetical protein
LRRIAHRHHEERPVTDRTRVAVLVWRELLATMRSPALWAVVGAQGVLLALYLLVWGDGVPLVGARPVLAQFATAQWLFLSLALPWAAARCTSARRPDDVAYLSALGSLRPSRIVIAVMVALTAILLGITATGLPFALLARQISAAPAADWWRTELPIFTLSLCVAPLTSACLLFLSNRLFAWIVATGATLVLLGITPAGAPGGLLLGAAGVAAAGLLVSRADAPLQYVTERG